jgi:ABC-type nitrate/sulfonate/bicarbonate transport system substrate-binding protein
MSLRTRIVATAATAATIALLAGCSASSTAGTSDVGAPSELATAGDSVPEVSLKAGFTPYADELLIVSGIERGYFDDVGITIDPAPFGAKIDLFSSLTPLLNGQVEVGSGGIPALGSQLDTVKNVVGFAIQDVFYGYRIMAPEGEYTTFAEAMDEGQSFEEAVITVFDEIKGKSLIIPEGTVPTFFDLFASTGGGSMDEIEQTNLDNPDLVRAALAGNAELVAPTGAQQITQLEVNGWESLINMRDLIENLPTDETTSMRTTYSGFLTTTDFAKDNWDTLLRFTSVMYRLIDDMETDGTGTAADFVDYLNSYTGSDLTAEEIAGAFNGGAYSMRNFEDAEEFYTDESDPFYVNTTLQSYLDNLSEQGVIEKDHTVSEMSISQAIYDDLVRYREAADTELADAPDGDLKTQAQTLYEHRDYLDAYRLAKQANQ